MTDINNEPINWNSFYQAYTGVKFSIKSSDCQVFVPTYSNISQTPSLSGTEMTFRDEWSSQSFVVAGSDEKINRTKLQELWTYAQDNIKWDEFNEQLSFEDTQVEKTTLIEFVKDLDNFLVYHKLSKFGDVWWSKRVTTDGFGNNSRNVNVMLSTLPNMSAGQEISFWSPDKWVNDEYKKYLSNVSGYNGFLIGSDFINGGWFTVPDLTVSTKPLEKLKIADVLLNINFVFDPKDYFGQYYPLDPILGVRIVDETTKVVLDETEVRGSQNRDIYADTIIAKWTGGLVSTANTASFGPVGSYVADPCEIKNEDINYISITTNSNEVSHLISAQMTLKPDYDSTKIDFLGTVDPINWISSNVQDNIRQIGILNQDRAFHGASGNRTSGIVAGGLATPEGSTSPSILSNAEIWSNSGFLKNVSISMNTPRCYHTQGGSGGDTCAVVGGYSKMNTTSSQEFADYSKDGVLDNVEVFVRGDDPSLSYFKTVRGLALNTARGDHAGYVGVSTLSRRDKFQIESDIKGYSLIENDEQKLLQFVDDKSSISSNFVRYAISDIRGFVYGGNTSGKSHLIDTCTSDIIDSFEKISSTYLIASEKLFTGSTNSAGIDQCVEIIKDIIQLPSGDPAGVSLTLPYCGKYRVQYLESNVASNECKETITDALSIPGWSATGTEICLPYIGEYTITLTEGGVNPTFASGPIFPTPFTINGDGSTPATTTATLCGKYRITLPAGVGYIVGTKTTLNPPDPPTVDTAYSTTIALYVNGVFVANIFDYYNYDIGSQPQRTYDFCAPINAQIQMLRVVRGVGGIIDTLNMSGAMSVTLSWVGVAGCPTCNDKLQQVDVLINDNYNSLAFQTSNTHKVCITAPKSYVRLRYHDYDGNYTNNNPYYGSVVVNICYNGPSSACVTNYGGVNVFINNIQVAEAFADKNIFTGVITDAFTDFCCTSDNSMIKFVSTTKLGGTINFSLCYLGKLECSCSNDAIKSISTDIAINYVTANASLTYPVRAHGMVYVGTESSGLSTGGRTEYNTLSNVISRMLAKYGSGYSTDIEQNIARSELESDRVLDLVYEYNGETWIRKQNLLESVYWHCGVGNATRAVFWGGLHDTVGGAEVSISSTAFDPNSIAPSAFACTDSKTFEKNIITENGVDYTNKNPGAPCWTDPFWTYLTNVYSNPRYQDLTTTLQFGEDIDYPPYNVVSFYNTLTAESGFSSITPKTSGPAASISWNPLIISETVGAGCNFNILATVNDTSNVTFGNAQIINWSSTIQQGSSVIYPTDINVITSTTIREVSLTDIRISFNNDVRMTYRFDYAMTYTSTSPSITGNTQYAIGGNGIMTFTTVNDIWTAILNNSTISPASHTFEIDTLITHNNSGINVTSGTTLPAIGAVHFTISNRDGIIVGVETKDQIWSASVADCGPDLSSIFNIESTFQNKNPQRWGVPLWSDLLVQPNAGTLSINYHYDMKNENVINNNEGISLFESGTISVSSNSISSILNSRILMIGSTVSQNHSYLAMNNAFIPSISPVASNQITNPNADIDTSGWGANVWGGSGSPTLFTTTAPDTFTITRDALPTPHFVMTSPWRLTAGYPVLPNKDWAVWTEFSITPFQENSLLTVSFDYTGQSNKEIFPTDGSIKVYIVNMTLGTATQIGSGLASFSGTFTNQYNFGLSAHVYRLLITENRSSHIEIVTDNPNPGPAYTLLFDNVVVGSIAGGTSTCENISASSLISFSQTITSDQSYGDWSTSFIQEYQSDQRYKTPNKWIQSNSFEVKPEGSGILFNKNSWRRYMDGVGLGGDTPDYDTFVDKNNGEDIPVSRWKEINEYFIGQKCFGTPDQAIIVGGHRTNDLIGKTGYNHGYHASPTSTRTFIWDLHAIPEEDKHLKNYYGRRIFNAYVEGVSGESMTFAPSSSNTTSSLNVVVFQAESDILVERQGSVRFDGTTDTISVVFDESVPTELGIVYSVTLSPSDSIQVWWDNKTTSGFQIKTAISGFIGTVDWSISAIMKVTESDITNNDPLNGYNFSK